MRGLLCCVVPRERRTPARIVQPDYNLASPFLSRIFLCEPICQLPLNTGARRSLGHEGARLIRNGVRIAVDRACYCRPFGQNGPREPEDLRTSRLLPQTCLKAYRARAQHESAMGTGSEEDPAIARYVRRRDRRLLVLIPPFWLFLSCFLGGTRALITPGMTCESLAAATPPLAARNRRASDPAQLIRFRSQPADLAYRPLGSFG